MPSPHDEGAPQDDLLISRVEIIHLLASLLFPIRLNWAEGHLSLYFPSLPLLSSGLFVYSDPFLFPQGSPRPGHPCSKMADDGGDGTMSQQFNHVPEGDPRGSRRSLSHRRRLSASSRSFHGDNEYEYDEQSSLLEGSAFERAYTTVPSASNPRRPRLSRHQSAQSPLATRPSRAPSFTQRLTRALSNYDLKDKTPETLLEDRVWYDQVS